MAHSHLYKESSLSLPPRSASGTGTFAPWKENFNVPWLEVWSWCWAACSWADVISWDLRCQDWCNWIFRWGSKHSRLLLSTIRCFMLVESSGMSAMFFLGGPISSHHYVHNPHSTTTTTTSTYYHGVSCEVITCMQCPRRSSNRLLVGERWRVAGYDHCRKMALLTPTDCSFSSGRYLPVDSRRSDP